MKITRTIEIEVSPCTILKDVDGERWVLLGDGNLHRIEVVGGAWNVAKAMEDYGPFEVWDVPA